MRIVERFLPLLTGFLALTGCSSADVLNFIIPRTGYSIHHDIAYGDNKRQHLDIYVPDKPDPSGSVIVFFYGGSWQKGNKETYRFVGQALASKGYVAVIADYRVYPEVYFPAFVEDGANALAWVHGHIREYGGNPSNIFLAGHSAGGYIAVMLTLNDSYLRAAGGKRSWIKGTIGIAGPYDFLPFTDPNIIALFSKVEDSKTQPITFVGPGVSPLLLLTGDQDDEVGAKNSQNLVAKLREFDDPVQERIYPGVAHIGIVLALADGFRSKAPILEDIDAFIHATKARK